MFYALVGGLAAAVDPAPSPSPTARPLEDWEVTPGLVGFLATFGVAVTAVLLFLSLTRHMRKANAYAQEHGIEIPERRSIGFRTASGDAPASPDVADVDLPENRSEDGPGSGLDSDRPDAAEGDGPRPGTP